MNRDAELLAEQYLAKLSHILDTLPSNSKKVSHVVEEAKRYFSDGRFYLKNRSFLPALAAASYAEGLLDSLRILGLVEFSWPEERYDEKK
jgi:FAD synthetase